MIDFNYFDNVFFFFLFFFFRLSVVQRYIKIGQRQEQLMQYKICADYNLLRNLTIARVALSNQKRFCTSARYAKQIKKGKSKSAKIQQEFAYSNRFTRDRQEAFQNPNYKYLVLRLSIIVTTNSVLPNDHSSIDDGIYSFA